MSEQRDRGRAAFQRRAWSEAFTHLSAVDHEAPLPPEDLERLAIAASLLGRDAECADLWSRAHHEFVRKGDSARGARCAISLAFTLRASGQLAQSGGWFARAQRLVDEAQTESAARGYLLLATAMRYIGEGKYDAAYEAFSEGVRIGERFRDGDLVTFARHGQVRALIRLGETARGVALFDEVMVGIIAGEVGPIATGVVYCSVIDACHEIFDLGRAQEWTSALNAWCASDPDMVAHRGTCLLRRAEIMQLHGEWPEAMEEAERARERLCNPPGQLEAGKALYQVAELHRLRGDFAKAEEVYRQASLNGCKPQPGLAQLRLAQGQIDSAKAAICSVLDEAPDRRTRSRLLAAYIEIMLATGDVDASRGAVSELSEIARTLDAPFLHALSATATGALLLAETQPQTALTALREAWTSWHKLAAPYEAARVRVRIGQAYRALGDEDSAEMELDAARHVFRELGALPDLARVESLSIATAPKSAGQLTPREVQLLCLLATGKTNRAIAKGLGISEKTVARHVSNIFTKLDLSSRAAATAYAYQHGLVEPRPT
jgi:DNA-binding CsgD family transcriptional regulator